MTEILLVETASPKRVRKKAEEILAGDAYAQPALTILCRSEAESVEQLNSLRQVRLIPLEGHSRRQILKDLRRTVFDVAISFWTGERGYRGMKLIALRLRAIHKEVDIGDGNRMQLTPGNFVRFLRIRWKYRQPADHDLFEIHRETGLQLDPPPDEHPGEKILILQSAEPDCILHALDGLKNAPFFRDPRYTLFCRNRLEILNRFRGHPMLHRIISHSEARAAWRHLLDLRRQRFDTVIVFFTGDPSYWKIKYFPFLLGARRKLIFNESNDCFFFSLKTWGSFLLHRMSRQSRPDARPRWAHPIRIFAIYSLKALMLPFRFLWLLLVWLWLRSSGLKTSV